MRTQRSSDGRRWLSLVGTVVLAAGLAAGVSAGPAHAGALGWELHDFNASGDVEHKFDWGPAHGWRAITGDWNGDGKDTPGIVGSSNGELQWRLHDYNQAGATEYSFGWGSAKCAAIVGDWNGDGKDTPGSVCAERGEWQWSLHNYNQAGSTEYKFGWGSSVGWWPIVGDWNGDGKDTPGVVAPRNGVWNWRLHDYNQAGVTEHSFSWGGTEGCGPVIGDWNGDDKDTPGNVCKVNGVLEWGLHDYNLAGAVEHKFTWAATGKRPVTGDWNGDGKDTPGVTTSAAEPPPQPQPPPPSSSGYVCPVKGTTNFTDTWGAPRSGGRTHKGTDMFAEIGTPLAAVIDGTIDYVQNTDSGLSGKYIRMFGADGNKYLYIHNDSNIVSAGQRVGKGEIIGYVGKTGNARSTPPHVHFEIHHQRVTPFNPYPSVHEWCPGHG